MITYKYSSANHIFTIMDTDTKKGVELVMVGEDMAKFLESIVKKCNENHEEKTMLEKEEVT